MTRARPAATSTCTTTSNCARHTTRAWGSAQGSSRSSTDSPPHALPESGQGHPMTRNSAFLWSALAVTLMVACAFGIFVIISAYGGRLTAPAAPAGDGGMAATSAPQDILLHVLVALAAV